MRTQIFVTPDWLAAHAADPNVQVLDARLLTPGMELTRNIQAGYLAGHIPNAPLFNIDRLSDPHSPWPHMLLPAEQFATAMRETGIDHQKHLVVYNPGNLFSAPRAW